ncbi:MAG TPA: hypothetical protein VLG11_01840 [Candidatus Saccharimonadales bacterium]|nr:hypothetical protein [Candidatus Saccharimonadales bacterium]
MKVHFLTSRASLLNDIESLRKIISTVKEAGHTLDDDWIEGAYSRETGKDSAAKTSANTKADWSAIFKNSIETIAKSDVVIAETSNPSFAIGYQVAVAVQQKKPVLLLRHEASDMNAYIMGVEDGWTQHENYTEDTLVGIVEKFIADNDILSKDMRFNFFIDRKIYNYLRWAALRTGKTKAEILRELVEREIDHENA